MSKWTRREALFASLVTPFAWGAKKEESRLSVEAYIFQQYAQRQHKPLGSVLGEVIPMAREAGFHNIELNPEFLSPELREHTLSLIRQNDLRLPAVYSGGILHESERAKQTIERALKLANLCKPFGCTAVVCNADPKPHGAEKTDMELAVQADQMNRLGRLLGKNGFELRIHNHTPEMVNGAREWRYTLEHTNPRYVALCLDLDWVHQGDQDPLELLKLAGKRVREIHVRNSKNKLWLEDLEDGDVDYRAIAAYMESTGIKPLIVVELAYGENTVVTRPLEKDLEISREYAEKIFGVKA